VVLEHAGVGRAEDRQGHLVGDRQKRVLEQLEPDGVARPAHRPPLPGALVGRIPQISCPSSMVMLPDPSRAARAPGGTTQVASYSSTMQGPTRGVLKSGRSRIGVSRQPNVVPKYTRRVGGFPPPGRSMRIDSGTRGRSERPWATTRRLTISTGSSG